MAQYDLPTAASKVKAARTNFAFFQGKKSNQVYISAGPAGGKALADLSAECVEPKRLFKGVCFVENEQFTFATKVKPSMVWEVLITKVFKEKKASKFLPVVLRQLGESESDEVLPPGMDDGTAAPAAPAAGVEEGKAAPAAGEAVDEEGEYRKLKAEVAPRISAAIKSNPENRDELVSLLSQAVEREKAGGFSDARALFFQLIGRLPAPSAAGAVPPPPKTPPPPPPKTPPPGGKALSASELSVAMKNIVPRLQQAIAAQPGRRAEIQALAAKFQTALNAGKLGDAQAAMMEALAVVKALAPGAPGAPGAAAKPADAGAEAVDDDERAYNEAEETAFTATWDKASKVWQDCVETVDGQIEKMRSAMQNSGDPDFEEIADQGLAALTNNHKTPVMVAVREIKSTTGDARLAAAAKARTAISSFRSHVLSDERIAACEEECEAEFGVPLTIREEITRGLDELEGALEAIPTV